MSDPIFFYTGLTCILMHEMDAIRCKEWRILPLTSFLDDKRGFQAFMLLHIPLFLLILYGQRGATAHSFMYGLDIFFIIHLGLHILFLRHQKNEFRDLLSWSIIGGAGLCGALDLIVRY